MSNTAIRGQKERYMADLLKDWPEESREAAQLVIDRYGPPHQSTDSLLTWHDVGGWKRIVASKVFYQHDFPAPHIDAVESVIDYLVPVDLISAVIGFDGSVVVERTAGEVSARCHDEEANRLALNLMHDIATGSKTAQAARDYYVTEFLDYRRKKPTPYMDKLQFAPTTDSADPDERAITEIELAEAVAEGKAG